MVVRAWWCGVVVMVMLSRMVRVVVRVVMRMRCDERVAMHLPPVCRQPLCHPPPPHPPPPPTPSHAGEVELEADKTMAELKVENDRVLYMTSSQ